MKLTIDHTAFAAAVSYAVRSLPARPPVPVLAGLLLDASSSRLRVSAFAYEISADTTAAATVTETGRALVSGRLLSDIVGTVRGDVHLELRGPRLVLKAGSARFILPTLPLDEYPALPEPGTITGTSTAPPSPKLSLRSPAPSAEKNRCPPSPASACATTAKRPPSPCTPPTATASPSAPCPGRTPTSPTPAQSSPAAP